MPPRKSSPSAQRYDVHPGVRMIQDWIAGLKEKSGRTFEEWLEFIPAHGPATEKERRAWLKEMHGLGTNTAWWLAERASGDAMGMAEEDPEVYLANAASYVREQYAGKKEALRPIYDRLYSLARSMGGDVRICPCKTIVPLYREHVFGEIKPSTNSRVDLGLALGRYDKRIPSRLIDTGGKQKKDRITHRFAIESVQDIDDDVERWLRVAYELDAPKPTPKAGKTKAGSGAAKPAAKRAGREGVAR